MTPGSPPSRQSAAAVRGRAPVDWDAVKSRLAEAARVLADAGTTGLANAEVVLQRRAAAVARPIPRHFGAKPGGPDTIDAIGFSISRQRCAVEAAHVREAVQVNQLTPLPGLPPAFRGLANVRSRIVPAFDLRPLLQLPPDVASRAQETLILVVHDGVEFAVQVDALEGSFAIPRASLRTDVPGLRMQHLVGVTADGCALLDLAAVHAALAPEARAT